MGLEEHKGDNFHFWNNPFKALQNEPECITKELKELCE